MSGLSGGCGTLICAVQAGSFKGVDGCRKARFEKRARNQREENHIDFTQRLNSTSLVDQEIYFTGKKNIKVIKHLIFIHSIISTHLPSHPLSFVPKPRPLPSYIHPHGSTSPKSPVKYYSIFPHQTKTNSCAPTTPAAKASNNESGV